MEGRQHHKTGLEIGAGPKADIPFTHNRALLTLVYVGSVFCVCGEGTKYRSIVILQGCLHLCISIQTYLNMQYALADSIYQMDTAHL